MKLLKLESEQTLTEASFTNNIYSGGWTIPPKSQICLKNLSMDFDQPLYQIIAEGEFKNNNFTFQVSNSIIHEIELTAGEYTLRDLIIEINSKMNNKLNSSSTQKGFQWSIGQDIDQRGNIKLIFSFDRADSIILNSATVQTTNISYNSGSAYFYKSGSNVGSFNAHLSGNTFVNPGGFECSVIIKNQDTSDIKLSDWIFGIDSDKTSALLPSKGLIQADMKACISSNVSGNYTFKIGGYLVQSSPAIQVAANDVLTIKKDNGKIVYTVLKGSTTSTVIGDDMTLHPLLGISNIGYMVHIGDDTGKIAFNSLTMTPTPYSQTQDGVYSFIQPQNIITSYLDTNLTVTASNVGLIFENANTRRLLGFSNTYNYQNVLRGSFTSNYGLNLDFLTNDLEIELVELSSVNSYSQSIKQTRGIVAVIPVSTLQNSTIYGGGGGYELSYQETASWCWLSIDNEQTLRLASLTIRALSGGKIVRLNGKMTACLLFKPESEAN